LYDKLDLRFRAGTPLAPEFREICGHLSGDHSWRNPSLFGGRWRPSQFYNGTASLEDCGIDAVVHMECRATPQPNHKVEILRMGEKTYDQAVELCSRIFVCDPAEVGIIRSDLTADIHIGAAGVDWCKRHMFIKAKQTRREFGTVEAYQLVTKGRAGTLYGGQKPEQMRIYNKTAEREMQYEKYLRKFLKASAALPDSFDLEPTTFLAMYGLDRSEQVTRVERQLSGRGLSRLGLTNIPSLLHGAELDPFDQIVFFESAKAGTPELASMSWRDRCVGEHIRHRVETLGLSDTLGWMKASLGRNFYRAKKEFAPFLRLTDNVVGIDAEGLRAAYQASTYRQLLRAA